MSKSNNLDMFALEANVLFISKQVCTLFLLLEVAAIEYNLDSSNPGTSKHPHRSNRIYDTLDSD